MFRHVQPAHCQVGVHLQRVPPRFPPELWNVTKRLSTGHLGRTTSVRDGTTDSFIWLAQASVNLDAGRSHPNGESESRDANRSGPDWSATYEANLMPLRQSADSPPRALSGSCRWPQNNRGVPDQHRAQHSLVAQ